jgi:hypothetical protein
MNWCLGGVESLVDAFAPLMYEFHIGDNATEQFAKAKKHVKNS